MTSKGRAVKDKPRLLCISDAVAHTGFAQVTHNILDVLQSKYDVHTLGINYFGDPHDYRYKIYPASLGGDVFGFRRLGQILRQVKPHLTFIINDPWVVKDYIDTVVTTPIDRFIHQDGQTYDVFSHIVAYMPVDGLNLSENFVKPLNKLDVAVGYTNFAVDQMRLAGLTIESEVVPHGVKTDIFTPVGKKQARQRLNNMPDDWFIVGCVNRNQPRKRLDLAMQYFAEWAKNKPDNVKFYYHGSLNDVGWNIPDMAEFFGIEDRLIITSPDITPAVGIPLDMLKFIYSSFDVQISTTAGEG